MVWDVVRSSAAIIFGDFEAWWKKACVTVRKRGFSLAPNMQLDEMLPRAVVLMAEAIMEIS